MHFNCSGCSVARLSRLLWEQEVASSNLATPTNKKPFCNSIEAFFILQDENLFDLKLEELKAANNRVGAHLATPTNKKPFCNSIEAFFILQDENLFDLKLEELKAANNRVGAHLATPTNKKPF